MERAEQAFAIYQTGETGRYHTEAAALRQSVARHCWGVTMLLLTMHPRPSVPLLRAAALHDAGEWDGPGDIPYPAKRGNQTLKDASDAVEQRALNRLCIDLDLTGDEYRWLKWADMAEIGLHCAKIWRDYRYPAAHRILTVAISALATFDSLDPELAEFRNRLTQASQN